MTTTLLKPTEIKHEWFVIDAKDKTLGHMAVVIANKLRGKDKPYFAPHMDCGDFVIVINADKFKLTGGKMDKKIYYTHSGFPGALKSEKAADLIARKPKKALELAVSGMLPKNKLRKEFMKKLKIYTEEEHPHTAQSPKTLEI